MLKQYFQVLQDYLEEMTASKRVSYEHLKLKPIFIQERKILSAFKRRSQTYS